VGITLLYNRGPRVHIIHEHDVLTSSNTARKATAAHLGKKDDVY